MTDDQSRQSISPAALALADAARLLTKVGGQPITEDMLRDDVADGAPTNPDGTLNLIHYCAWVLKEMAHAD
jgi:hypothetical protein